MQDSQISAEGRLIGILLFEGFSNLCLANAVEPLRAANDLSGRTLYRWQFLSLSGEIVRSSSDLPVQPARLADFPGGDYLFVMPSYGYRAHATPACGRALRAARARFGTIVGLDTGSWLLAAAGLLDGRKVTAHWDILTSLGETFPEIDVVRRRYVADGNIMSCGGATTTLELLLDLIGQHHGFDLSLGVDAMFMFGERTMQHEPMFRLPANRLVRAAAALMRRHVERPVSIDTLADELKVSQRSLESAFNRTIGKSPSAVYRTIRLDEARRWIEQSSISIAEVAQRCGYQNPSAMTRAFKEAFGLPPQMLRKALDVN